ncbi:endolytic transglycosylase MltG [Microbacter sp. GSS18]|nr:endolytic transglycosylase MltG [Microbacter sp. GSS18]
MTPDSFDDPFADLFGRPSRPAADSRRAERSEPTQPPTRSSSETPAAAAAPMTRREAREAAARAAAAQQPAAASPAQASPARPSAPAPQAAPRAAAPARPATAPNESAPRAAAAPQAASTEPEWHTAPASAVDRTASEPVDDTALLAAPRRTVVAQDDHADAAEEDAWAGFIGTAQAATTPALPYSRTGTTGPTPTAEEPATPEATAQAPREPSLEDLFSGASSSDEMGAVPPPKNKRKRRIGGWIALGVVLVILGGIGAGGLWVWNTYEEQIRSVMGWEEPQDYEAGQATGEALLTISSGDVPSNISQSLFEAGVTKTPEAFYDHLIDTGQNPTFYPGVYRLQQRMTSAAALDMLQDPANKLENSALLREGLTVDQTLPILAEGLGLPLEDFTSAVGDPSQFGVSADSLEGWLFPAMYTFDPGITATGVIQAMVDRTVESLDAAGVPEADRQRILTIASIIQREARFEDDFYRVSRVIENRMDPNNQETFGLLQMDSTAQYGYGEMHDGTVSSSAEALEDDNPWNTYVNPGLPVGPIANPGDTAIDAAMHPADGDWLYFVTVNLDTGETVFTTNLADHNRAVAQWQDWCAANPDSGC